MKLPTIIKQEALASEAGVSKLAKVWFTRNSGPVLLKEPAQFWNEVFIKNESEILETVTHPRVRRKLAYDGATHRLYLEFIEAETLQNLVKAGVTVQHPSRAHRLLQGIAEAMADLHDGILCELPIIHNDLKSLNVLVPIAAPNEIALIDFSHSYFEGQLPSFITDDECRPAGTAKYMAPEKRDGDYEHGRQGDVFAFGVLAYYTVTGRFPFEGDAAELERQIREVTPPTPIQLGKNVLRTTQAVIMACLEKQPNRRPSMEQIARCYAESASLFA